MDINELKKLLGDQARLMMENIRLTNKHHRLRAKEKKIIGDGKIPDNGDLEDLGSIAIAIRKVNNKLKIINSQISECDYETWLEYNNEDNE